MHRLRRRPDDIVWFAAGFEGGLVLLACGLGWLLEYSLFEQVHLSWQAVGWGAVATCPLLLAMFWCVRSQRGPFPALMRELESVLVRPFAGCSYFDLALISILAGIGEEALFRGVMQSVLADLLNPWVALVLVSTLFGLGHFITPAYAVLAGLLGLYLGGLVLLYDNLLVVIVVHGLYDFLALMYLLRRHRAQLQPVVELRSSESNVQERFR